MKIFRTDLFPLNSGIPEPLTESARHYARQRGTVPVSGDIFGKFARNQGKRR